MPNGSGAPGGTGDGDTIVDETLGAVVGGPTAAGDGDTTPGAGAGGAATIGVGFGQTNNCSPVGSIRGPCHVAQPVKIIAHHTARAVNETRNLRQWNIGRGWCR